MPRLVLTALAALTAFAADNPWDKVRELKTGTELRILKKGARQPILATMDEANDERLIVVIKNEQLAIQKDDIDRIDFRPATKSKIAKETRTTQTDSTQTTPVGAATSRKPSGAVDLHFDQLQWGPEAGFRDDLPADGEVTEPKNKRHRLPHGRGCNKRALPNRDREGVGAFAKRSSLPSPPSRRRNRYPEPCCRYAA